MNDPRTVTGADAAPMSIGADLQRRIEQCGRRLLAGARAPQRWWRRFVDEDAVLDKLMADDRLRIAALRFVDVLPALDEDAELTRHLDEYFDDDVPLPWPAVAHWGLRQARHELAAHVVAPVVRALAGRMARRFIAASDLDTATRTLERLYRNGMAFTLDLLGEAVVSEVEAEQYQAGYLNLLRRLTPVVNGWGGNPLLDRIGTRRSPRMNVSIKVSALYSQLDPLDPDRSVAAISERLRPIMLEARRVGAFVTLDMEHYQTKDVTLRVFRELLSEEELADWPDVGIAIQAYLRDTPGDLQALIKWAQKRECPVTVRLVRGAYWDYETIIAQQHGWSIPVWTRKDQTDACYEHCLKMLIDAHPHVEAAIATHNARSLAAAMVLCEQRGIDPGQYEVQMLYGMAETLKATLVEIGQRLRVYVPFGDPIPGMAYLVRRLLENTASQSFVRMGFAEDAPAEQLLAPPPPLEVKTPLPKKHDDQFVNEPLRRFTDKDERCAFFAALGKVEAELGGEFPLVIGGERRTTHNKLTSVNPAAPKQIIGTTASASSADAKLAIDAAAEAFKQWRRMTAEQRAEILRRAASLLREHRDQFAALEVFEAAKPWREADADVVEAIDFIEYYAQQAIRLERGQRFDVPGETNAYFYEPRGVGAVIAPWNFPLAIPAGMAVAAIAAGNTVVLKPAPQTPVIIARFVELMHEAGLPAGVINYLPGGDDAGAALVRDARVSFIAFTGSQAAGCEIYETASRLAEGQTHLKHVVAELGGKNAIIIDSDADLDDAVLGVVGSAFGYAGQKCSAASRAIVVGSAYDAFVQRLVAATESLRIGPPADPGTFVPPVIDDDARKRISIAIGAARSEAECLLHRPVSEFGDGYFVGPTVFGEVDPAGELAQQEIFGPVLAVMRARDFAHAIEIANHSRYALTGGVYTRSPAHLKAARRAFRVGNLYLNRKITGAIVGRQPFGGYKLSGTNAKAGGPDYLLHFVEARTVTENTIRRGFAPPASE